MSETDAQAELTGNVSYSLKSVVHVSNGRLYGHFFPTMAHACAQPPVGVENWFDLGAVVKQEVIGRCSNGNEVLAVTTR